MSKLTTVSLASTIVWRCDSCGRKTQYVQGTSAPLASQWFAEEVRWEIVELADGYERVTCDRCLHAPTAVPA